MPPQTRRILSVACVLMFACLAPLHWLGVDLVLSTVRNDALHIARIAALLLAFKILARAPLLQFWLEVTLWGSLFASLACIPMALLVRLPVPLVDRQALALDAAFGIHPARWVAYCAQHPLLRQFLSGVYNSLPQADLIGVALPVVLKRPRWSSEMFVALILALIGTLVIMTFAQGIGPWVVDGAAPRANQAELAALIRRFKAAPHIWLDAAEMNNFVAFPSWHVMLAMLAAFSTARVRVLREVSLLWVLLVAVSTLTMGWHYGVDVLSGALLCTLSMLGSRYLHRRWDAQRSVDSVRVMTVVQHAEVGGLSSKSWPAVRN